jgi:hypothetical protein
LYGQKQYREKFIILEVLTDSLMIEEYLHPVTANVFQNTLRRVPLFPFSSMNNCGNLLIE